MSREPVPMRPRVGESMKGASDALSIFEAFGQVRRPHECDQPILGPATRQLLHGWLHELNYGEALAEVGVKPRTRALLQGPPGTGKTTLAWHISARLGLPLIVIETPSLVSKWVGATGENIGQLFALARAKSKEVALFFDEFDSVATKRGDATSSAGHEKNATVVSLLQMMDRHDGLIFAATNRPDIIDPAIWRRFQMQIEVPLPGEAERFAIVRRYLAPFALHDDGVEIIASALAGASPALIREVVEAIKRDLVLGPKLGHDLSAVAMLARVRAGTSPSEDMPNPPLWAEQAEADAWLASSPWPPVREAA